MDWQTWVAPSFVGVVIGIIATLVTGHLTRRHTEKMWHLQRGAQLKDATKVEGRKLADVALVQLNMLREDLAYTVFGRHDDERDERCRIALDELARVTLVTPDRPLRDRLNIVHDLLSRPDDIVQWGVPPFDPRRVVGVGTAEGISAVTAYIRGDEELPEPSDTLREMHASHEVAMKEIGAQYEEQDRIEKDRRASKKPNP